MDTTSPRKILISAFAFSPNRGSEFGVGWDYVRAIAANNEVWVLTRSNERNEVETYFEEHPEVRSRIHVHYISWSTSSFEYFLNEIPFHFMFVNWQRRAYKIAKKLHSEIRFDAAHQLTPIGFREPGYLWKLDCLFFWGPVGGLQYFPTKLLKAVPLKYQIFFVAKNATTVLSMHVWKRPRLAAKKASVLIAGTGETARRMDTLWGRKDIPVLCEVNSPDRTKQTPLERQDGEPFRIIWTGNCEPRKALNLVLEALSIVRKRSPRIDWQLICVGDGPLRVAWEQQAKDLKIADRCHFKGKVTHAEAIENMAQGHCFVQPSVYDATSSVLVEALANGLPAICLDHFGFRDVVDSRNGIRVSTNSVDHAIQGFASAIETLAGDESMRRGMAMNALLRSDTLTWRHKEKSLKQLYDSCFANTYSGLR